MKTITLKFVLLSAAAAMTAVPAFADTLNLTLNTPSITLAPGSTYEFDGTIAAPPTNSSTEFLGDSFSIDAPLTLDDTDFLVDTPLFLDPGQSYTGALFTVTVPSAAALGTYVGFFNVIGNNDPAVSSTARFTVTAANATAVTPEPGSWLLLTTGLGAFGVMRRRFARA